MKTHLLLLLCFLLAACGPSPEQQATMTATALTATAAAWTPTFTATASPTATATATNTATPTLTSTPTPVPTATRKPTKTPIPTDTPDPNRYFAPDNSYSLIPPEGWLPMDVGEDQPVLVGPTVGNYDIHMRFILQESTWPVAIYSAMVQDSLVGQLQNLNTIGEEFLTTDEGHTYFRWEMTFVAEGRTLHQVFYFFESGDWKLVIAYTRPNDAGAEYDALVDEAMETVRYTR